MTLQLESLTLGGRPHHANLEWVTRHSGLEHWERLREPEVERLVARGWAPDHARTYALLYMTRAALGRALRERDACYAASIYAISDALYAQRRGTAARTACDGSVTSTTSAPSAPSAAPSRPPPPPPPPPTPPPMLYANRTGKSSLTNDEPAWARLETPDASGFRGLCSSALVRCSREPECFRPEGYAVRTAFPA